MKFKSPLSQRIILSFVLLTGIVSGLFAIGLWATIHYVEESLVNTELQKDFARVIDDYKNGENLRLDEGSSFFTAGPTLPDYLRSVATGYTEIVLEDRAFYIYHVREGENSYFLVKDQTAFEKGEILLHRVVLGGFALSIVVSFVIGLFMVKQVIAPVRRLTRQVVDQQGLRNELPSLSSGYADDEVGALAKAFDGTITRLQQALQRETLFTSDVSHELRTPLMVINSSCDVLIAKKDPDEYVRQKIDSISRSANEINGLVEAFLALARGKDSHPEMTTLNSIVESEYQTWIQLAAEKGNCFRLQEESENAEQTAGKYPAIMLRTVLGNLIRNAIHHTTGGEIILVLRPGGFDLRDTGSGIAEEDRAQVFKPYYRGTASHRDGLGLGLSLVQRICEREEWTVVLEENQPSGCCFRINFV
jgi:signal transduction histidine kinase